MNRATSAYVEMVEAMSPVPEEQDNLIKSHFKSCYFPQIHCWLICQKKESKKKKLFDFLNCVTPLKKTVSTPLGLAGTSASILRSRTALSTSNNNLIYRSLNCTIDFSPMHNQRPSTRRIDRNRFSSPGSDAIFKLSNSNEPSQKNISTQKVTSDNKCSTLAQFYAKKLLQPFSSKSHFQIADQYFDLLNELSSWVDRKCNHFPVDELRMHPTLSPNYERQMNYEQDRSDHLLRQSSQQQSSGFSQSSVSAKAWKTPTTAYSSFFENAGSYKPEILSPFLPMERSSPFCKFPMSEQKIEHFETQNQTPKEILNQSVDNRKASTRYKNIFQSKTCL